MRSLNTTPGFIGQNPHFHPDVIFFQQIPDTAPPDFVIRYVIIAFLGALPVVENYETLW
jgi:hypothetical protein